MKNIIYLIVAFSIVILSCEKNNSNNTTVINQYPLSGTNWDLYYKSNSTFTFYALSKIDFKSDSTCLNYRNFDTLVGTWRQNNASLNISFSNGDKYNGTFYSIDSITGTTVVTGNNGLWYANKKY